MSRSFKYLGPFDEVEVPAVGAVVARGETVEVADPDVADGLAGQTDSWEHIPDKQRSQAAKKAAAARADDSDDSREG